MSRKEKEDILEKLSQAERMLAEGRNRVNKLEDDNAKLRRALEQSMSRINRMSMDSDYFVDRLVSACSLLSVIVHFLLVLKIKISSNFQCHSPSATIRHVHSLAVHFFCMTSAWLPF